MERNFFSEDLFFNGFLNHGKELESKDMGKLEEE